MLQQLKLLVKLQALDKLLYDLQQEQSAIPERLEELDSTEKELERSLALKKARLEELGQSRENLEKENEGIRARVRRAETRLMNSKSQREVRAATAEIEEGKDALRSNDDALLEIMESSEKLQAEAEDLAKLHEEAAAEAAAQIKDLKARLNKVQKEVEKLASNRGGLTDGVQPELMSQYDFIRKNRAGVALAPVSNGTCLACHMQLPPQQFNELQRMDRAMYCPTCRRLMYWSEAEGLCEES